MMSPPFSKICVLCRYLLTCNCLHLLSVVSHTHLKASQCLEDDLWLQQDHAALSAPRPSTTIRLRYFKCGSHYVNTMPKGSPHAFSASSSLKECFQRRQIGEQWIHWTCRTMPPRLSCDRLVWKWDIYSCCYLQMRAPKVHL